MPLRDFFSKKNKSRSDFGESIPTSPTLTTSAESPTSEHSRRALHPDDAFLSSPTKSTNSSVYPSLADSSPGSSSKLRLFGRRKAPKPTASSSQVSLQPPPSFVNRLSTSIPSESDSPEIRRNLGPPPSRSAIFSAYADPHSASSTRSLPTEYPAPTETLPIPKRPIFPWSSKSQPNTTKKPKPKSPPPRAEDISAAFEDSSSFNLKGFRHLRAPSPDLPPPPIGHRDSITDSANSSAASLLPPRPIPGSRSRNSSIGSLNDPSASQQRISVAAFREAQARRSLAGSPVPGPRSPSPGPNLSHHRSPASHSTDVRPRTTSMVALGKPTSSDEELSSEEEDDSDSDKRVKSKKTILKSKAKSEAGHGSSSSSYKPSPSSFPLPNTSLRPNAAVKAATPRSQSAVYPVATPNLNSIAASASTGALGYRTAAPPQVRSATLPLPVASDSDSDDSDDAPLATLIPPKRPGSAASSRSNPQSDAVSLHSLGRAGGGAMRPRLGSNPMPKPLIDIAELTAPNKRSTDVAAKVKSQEGFTGGATLLSGGIPTQNASSTKVTSPVPSSITSTSPPGRRFVSPPPSPPLAHRTSPQMLSQLPGGLAQRRIPMGRKDVDSSSMVSSTASSNDGGSGGSGVKKKDLLSERLSKVAQGATTSSPNMQDSYPVRRGTADTIGRPSSDVLDVPRTSSPSMQDSYPLRRGTADTTGRPSSDVLDVPRTSSPSPLLEKSWPGHKRDWFNGDFDPSKETVSTPTASVLPASVPPAPVSKSVPKPTPKPVVKKRAEIRKSDDSGMEDLAALLGAGIKLVSVNGEDPTDTDLPFASEDGLSAGGSAETEELAEPRSLARLAYDPPPSPNRITPIVVQTRPANPSFSVTSRPKHGRGASLNIISTTSDTIMDSVTGNYTTATTTTTTTATAGTTGTATHTRTRGPPSPDVPRPRSTTLLSPSKPSPSRPGPSILLPKASVSNVPDMPMPSSPTADSEASSTSSSSTGSGSGKSESGSGNASSGYGSEPSRKGAQPRMSKPPPRSMSASQMPSVVPAPTSRFPGPKPIKPFALSQSPASSTGGSSSANGAPNTPRDGSDIGDSIAHKPSQEEKWGSGVSGLSFGARHSRRKSIAFEDEVGSVAGNGKSNETPRDGEARRKERRRSEARAAIELGNTINGPGPILDDDDDEDLPINQTAAAAARMNGMNSMMMNPAMPGMLAPQATGSPMWGWPAMPQMPQMPGQMLSPAQFMVPPPTDPAFFAAHQQAMMFAKQAYQMAVAQQAMAAAADEWERGSTIGFSSSQSMYGMPPSAPSMMGSPFGMGAGNGWSTGSTIFPSSGSRLSMYGTGAMSEYGGGGGRGANWHSSRSVYGESFGPSSSSPSGRGGQSSNSPNRGRMSSYSRDSGYFPPVPPIPPQANKNAAASTRQSANPRARTVSQPAHPARHHDTGTSDRSPARRAPPSSWKTNGA